MNGRQPCLGFTEVDIVPENADKLNKDIKALYEQYDIKHPGV